MFYLGDAASMKRKLLETKELLCLKNLRAGRAMLPSSRLMSACPISACEPNKNFFHTASMICLRDAKVHPNSASHYGGRRVSSHICLGRNPSHQLTTRVVFEVKTSNVSHSTHSSPAFWYWWWWWGGEFIFGYT